jgi:hypothetical protein
VDLFFFPLCGKRTQFKLNVMEASWSFTVTHLAA